MNYVGDPIIEGHLVQQSIPLDIKQYALNQADRLTIVYPYYGLLTRQIDTGQVFQYITANTSDGSAQSNTVPDWQLIQAIYTGSGVPASSLGVLSDIYIDETTGNLYKKTGVSTWTLTIPSSGSKFYSGSGVPSGGLGNNGDVYLDITVGNLYTKSAGTWSVVMVIKGAAGAAGDKYATTSATSINFATATAPLTLTIGTGLSYTVGQVVIVASLGTPSAYLTGTITSYNAGTGVMILSPITLFGTGVHNDLVVNLQGVAGKQGIAFKVTAPNITLTQTLITSIIGGAYTPQAPYVASVQNDTRSTTELVATANIVGNMTGHVIQYDGVSWADGGNWVGGPGVAGPAPTMLIGTVNTGAPGSAAAANISGSNPYSLNLTLPQGIAGPTGSLVLQFTASGSLVIPAQSASVLTLVTVLITVNSSPACNITVPAQGVGNCIYRVIVLSTGTGVVNIIPSSSQKIAQQDGKVMTSAQLPIPTTYSPTTYMVLEPTYTSSTIEGWVIVNVVPNVDFFKPSVPALMKAAPTLFLYTAGALSGSWTSISYTSNAYVLPRLDFQVDYYSNTNNSKITFYVEYSDDLATWNQIKQIDHQFVGQQEPMTATIFAVDNSAPIGTLRYYRLRWVSTAAYSVSIDYDYMITPVLRY